MLNSKNINFRTVLKPIKFDFERYYKSSSMFIGSCFTENIGELLKENKFKIDINPFGILYNPVSVKNSIDILIDNRKLSEKDIFNHNEQWHSFSHHSRFSNTDKENTLNNINKRISDSSDFLKNTDYLFITFGTSWVYENIESGNIVSNCHKLPAKKFKRRLLKPGEIINIYLNLLNKISVFNKNLKIVFTISPIRHLKDGFSENNLSKSILRIAIEELISNNSNCYYFPAYELQVDDLRDYRFYESDMLHPNKLAIDYIFNFFKNSYFSVETFSIFHEIQKIIRAKEHKPFNSTSNEYKKFKQKNIENIKLLKSRYEFINLKEDFSFFNNK